MNSPHVRGALLALFCLPLCIGFAQAAELVVNGGFEMNGGDGSSTFIGWSKSAQAGSQGGFFAQSASLNTKTPVSVSPPPEGTYAAMSDQPGPGSHALYQDIALPTGQPITLVARVYVQNAAALSAAPASLDFTGSAPNQQARIDVMSSAAALDDVGAGVLANVFQWPAAGSIGAAPAGAPGTGYQTVQRDLSAYAGQTIRLRIAEVDNRQSLFFGVDGVSVFTGAAPSGLGAPTNLVYLVQGSSAQLSFTAVPSTPSQTVTGYVAQCTPQGGGASVNASAAASPITLNALTAGTTYTCQVAAQTASTTGPFSSTVTFTVPAAGSGIAVVPDINGASVPVQLGAGGGGGGSTTCVVQAASFTKAANLAVPPPQGATAFPFGIFTVKATSCAPGSTMQITLTMPQPIPAGAAYWKYGPTPGNAQPHWYVFGGFSASGNVMTLTIKDGGEGDSDLLADGVINDPGGIMVVAPVMGGSTTPVPLWNAWWVLLATLALAWGMRARLQRRA